MKELMDKRIEKELYTIYSSFCYKKTPRSTWGSVNAMHLTRNPPNLRI